MENLKNKLFNPKTMLIGMTVLVLGSVFTVYYSQNHWDSLASRGPIGDFLAGTIGPVINLVGIILVYFSFHQQVIANQIQYKGLQETIKSNKQTHNFNVADTTFNYINNKFISEYKSDLHSLLPSIGNSRDKFEIYKNNTQLRNFLIHVLYFGISIMQTDMNNQDKSLLLTKYITFCKDHLSQFIRILRIEFHEINQDFDDPFIDETISNTEFYAMLIINLEKMNNKIFQTDLIDKAKLFENVTQENIIEFYSRP